MGLMVVFSCHLSSKCIATMKFLVSFLAAACHLHLLGAVGIKRRLAENQDVAPDSSADASTSAASSSSGLRGGIRQRLAANVEGAVDPTPVPGPLYQSLKRDWAKGVITSKQVQEYAWGAWQQGASGMQSMGATGNSGKNPSYMFKAMKHLLGMPTGAPDFFGG